jgi:hypothetical protein
MKVSVHFPWIDTPVKGGFFVPTLQLEETRLLGLRAAVYHKVRAKADFGMKDGKLGVWFTRVT